MNKIILGLLFFCTVLFHLAAEENEWFAEKFPTSLIKSSGKTVDTKTALKGKTVAVYFSASSCGPCRGFTPTLVKFYKKTAKKGNFELVFISSDKTEKDMEEYMKKYSMPWLAVPFGDPAIRNLEYELKVGGIPRLVVFGSDGKILSSNARWDVVMLGTKAADEWNSPEYKPKTYQDYKEQRDKKGRKGKKAGKRR